MFLVLAVVILFHCASCDSISSTYHAKFGHKDVLQFGTAIVFYVNTSNSVTEEYSLKIVPVNCCLRIDHDDIDCSVMNLGAAKSVFLGAHGTASTKFVFRNMYSRYRRGNCTFQLSIDGKRLTMKKISFDTYPQSYKQCRGIDQDPDRGCSPVDCAIKYKGTRNFYRNATGKCEPVVPCNTRDKDGVTITAYYDWVGNKCVKLKWLHQDNYVSDAEVNVDVPVDIDPSQTKYFPDLEPHLLQEKTVELNCNNGYQEGVHCVCHRGWISSGIHYDRPAVFNWCDQPLQINTRPSGLSNPLYYSLITILIVANLAVAIVWSCLCKRFGCPAKSKFWKSLFRRCCNT